MAPGATGAWNPGLCAKDCGLEQGKVSRKKRSFPAASTTPGCPELSPEGQMLETRTRRNQDNSECSFDVLIKFCRDSQSSVFWEFR